MNKSGYLINSEGAKIVEVIKDTDKAPMPPLVVIKSNGATLYATRELATITSRMKRFSPKEIWYIADMRQELYFHQVFRASYKTGLVPQSTKLDFYGIGTMNGKDGKPFKTRNGGVMRLENLIDEVNKKVYEKMDDSKEMNENEKINSPWKVESLEGTRGYG